jgi:hypothetical protein
MSSINGEPVGDSPRMNYDRIVRGRTPAGSPEYVEVEAIRRLIARRDKFQECHFSGE